MGSLKITTTTTIEPLKAPPATPQSQKSEAPLAAPQQAASLSEDVLNTSQVTSGLGVIKKVAGGLLIGGTVSGITAGVAKTMATDILSKPGVASIGLGAALGAGMGLASIETGSKALNTAKNTVAGALIGGSATGMVQSVASTMATNYLHGPSTGGILMGAAVGGGIQLLNNDTGDKNLNNVKNVAAGALIGGGALGIISATATTMATNRLSGLSPVAAGLGAALGAGIAIMNMEE